MDRGFAAGEHPMTRKTNSHPVRPLDKNPAAENGQASRLPREAELLGKVARLLQEGRAEKAVEAISHSKLLDSPWVKNALGVCLLRLGEAERAARVLRELVTAHGSITLRQDAPNVFKANFAAALLAGKNISGCLSVLSEVNDEANPTVQQIRDLVRRWQDSLSPWQRFQWRVGSMPASPLVVDVPLGSLG
jgi:hypothetical protein